MTRPAITPALQRLLAEAGVCALSAESADAFVASGVTVLFFTGNAARYPEIDDVATILPELMREFASAFRVGVIDPDVERALAVRFKVTVRPTLILLRDGVAIDSLPKMRDWAVYMREFNALLHPTASLDCAS